MFLQESAILSLLSHRQAERMIRLHLMRLLLLILMTVHTRVILNRQVKREFTLMHISIIRLLISLFHTHQKAATIVSITGMEIKNVYNEFKPVLGDYVPVAEYAMSTTNPLRKES
mgnify:CR=1 FL=1